jgi:HEAT repeat protein
MEDDNTRLGSADSDTATEIAGHLATLAAITNSGDAKFAAQALARLGSPGLAALTHLLADSTADTEARQWAALALGGSHDEAVALGPLVAALHDVNGARYLPLAAAVALGQLGTAGAAEALVAVLDGPSEIYSSAPYFALREIGAPALPALQRALETGSDLQRGRAAYLLGWLREPKAFEVLIGALRDPYAPVRLEAAGALGALGDARAAPALLPLLADTSADVRAAAAYALGRCGGAEAVPTLERLRAEDHETVDTDEWEEEEMVSEYAARALDQIADRLAATRIADEDHPGEAGS